MIFKKTPMLCAFFALCIGARACLADAIIFDLGGVLFDKNSFSIACDIGIRRCISTGNITKAREVFFEFLTSIEPRDPSTPLACDENGRPLPQIMCDWLSGTKTNAQIRSLIYKEIHRCNPRYQKFVKRLACVLFTPELSSNHYSLIPSGVEFVLSCIRQGHDVYIISNWDRETFDLIYQKNRGLFDLFKGIIISGDVGLIKPDPTIFYLLLTEYRLDPAHCFFIDDQECNIRAARSCGITAICCPATGHLFWKKPDFDLVRKQLDNLCALKSGFKIA